MQDEKDRKSDEMEIFRSSGVLKWGKNAHFNTPDGKF